jgi:hypothetical protein
MSSNDVNALFFDYYNGQGAYQRQNMATQSYLTQATNPSIGYSNSSYSGGSSPISSKSVYGSDGVYSSSRYM